MLAGRHIVLPLAVVALFLPARAFAFGIGIEGGVTGTYANGLSSGSNAAGGATLGLIVEDEFDLPLIFLDVWADGQLNTLRFQTGGVSPAEYLPFDLGLRVGLGFALLHPYVGLFGQMAFPTSDGGGPSLSSPLFGVGGDLGLDIAVFIFRFGVELRGVDILSSIPSDGSGVPSGAWEIQGLGSARFSF